MRKSFIINGILVSLQGGGKVKIFTNSPSQRKTASLLKEYFEAKKGNKVCLLFDDKEMVKQYKSVFESLYDKKIRELNIFNMIDGLPNVIELNGCATAFTTNGHAQYDNQGKEYADRNNFKVIKVNSIKPF